MIASRGAPHPYLNPRPCLFSCSCWSKDMACLVQPQPGSQGERFYPYLLYTLFLYLCVVSGRRKAWLQGNYVAVF